MLLSAALAAGACDDDAPPADAAASDAPTVADAAPVDAVVDAALPDTGVPDAALADAAPPDAPPPCVDDVYEGANGNDSPALATVVNPAGSLRVPNAYLCSNTEDWYRIQTNGLGYPEYYVFLRAFANSAPYCPDVNNPKLPPGPDNTLTIELYDASGNNLLGSVTDDQGAVWINANGPEFGQDFLIRVTGPPGVSYPYEIRGWIIECLCEDECEA